MNNNLLTEIDFCYSSWALVGPKLFSFNGKCLFCFDLFFNYSEFEIEKCVIEKVIFEGNLK